MRVSNAAIVLAWVGLFFQSSESRSQEKRALPELPKDFLSWPFAPGEQWRVVWSYDVQGESSPYHTSPSGTSKGIRYALDLQRVEGRAATLGSSVRAAAPGTILEAREVRGYGKTVVIDHGNGFATRYAHLSDIDPSLSPGMKVNRLSEIGKAGSTGNSEGAHLHFEVRRVEQGKLGATVPPAISGDTEFADAYYRLGRFKGPYSYSLDDVFDPPPSAVAADVAQQLADFFGGKPEGSSDEVAEIARREAQKIVPGVAKDVAKLFGGPSRGNVAVDPSDPMCLAESFRLVRWTIPEGFRDVSPHPLAPSFERPGQARRRATLLITRGEYSWSGTAQQMCGEFVRNKASYSSLTDVTGPREIKVGRQRLRGWHATYSFRIPQNRFHFRWENVWVDWQGFVYEIATQYEGSEDRSYFDTFLASLDFVDPSGPANTPAVPDADAFAQARDFTRRWEGGYVNDPDDAGGATNFGITQRTYDRFRKEWGQTSRGVRDISAEEVSTIYRSYWESSGAEDLPAPLSAVHFDSFFHFNPRRAETWKNEVVKAHPDDPVAAAQAYVEKRIAFRHGRVKKEPSQKKFLKGWLNRDHALMELVTGGAK